MWYSMRWSKSRGVVLLREKGELPKFCEGRENSENFKGEKGENILKGEGKIFQIISANMIIFRCAFHKAGH